MDEAEILREAARIAGSKRTERKAATARENGKKGGRPAGTLASEETKLRMSNSQKARWERRKQDMAEKAGAALHSDDIEARREAARLLGQARSERKAAAARENGKKNTFTEETRVKLRAAQQARRERERQQKATDAQGRTGLD